MSLRVLPAPDEGDRWRGSLVIGEKGPAATVGNATLVLSNHPAWNGVRFDKLAMCTTISNPPPIAGWSPPDHRLDDYSGQYIAHWLHKVEQIKISPNDAIRAAETASKQVGRSYHPVRDYLQSLHWDGQHRVDSWLTDYLGAERNDYTSAIGRKWLISAIARIMRPGCMAKSMVILEGAQNAGKSTALRKLCADESWFSDAPVNLGHVDSYQVLRGKWIYEVQELDSFRGREATKIKSYISTPVDTYRKSYGRDTEDVPRQCVFAGTTNESEYLDDATGNVRFWPVKILHADFAAIERDRDQLWAEALSYYHDGHTWHVDEAELGEHARKQAADREKVDPWHEVMEDWVSKPVNKLQLMEGLTIAGVATDVLGVPTKDLTHHSSGRIGAGLRKLGFTPKGRVRPRRYYKEQEENERE